MIDDMFRAKLGDFGISKVIHTIATTVGTKTKFTETPQWSAPETFGLEPKYSPSSDIFSFGMILWELMTRKIPFEGIDPFQVIAAVKSGERAKIPEEGPKEMKEIVRKCWEQEPEKRPTSKEVSETLEKQLEVASREMFELTEATEGERKKVSEAFERKPIEGKKIGRVMVIHNDMMEGRFKSTLKMLQERSKNPKFEPKWPSEEEGEEEKKEQRKEVIQKLEKMSEGNRKEETPDVKILMMWHGTHRDAVEHICREGFANLATTDIGFYGKGIYGTWEVECADEVYGHGKHGDENGALILCEFSTFSSFPVILEDLSKFRVQDPETGEWIVTGNIGNHDSHFIPVRRLVSGATSFFPCNRGQPPEYHELVVFESSQILPRFLVELVNSEQHFS